MFNTRNQFKKLAIAGAVGAAMLGVTAAEAGVVSYHVDSAGLQAPNNNGSATTGSWTNGAPSALGTVNNLPETWLADMDAYSTNYVVSATDAITNHGAASGFKLESTGNKWKPASSWGNALDYGMINLQVGGSLTVTVEADSSLASTFAPGFTLWSGWGNAGTGNKHQDWNATPTAPNSLSVTGITYVGHDSTTTDGGSVTHVFNNLAAGKYLLWIGGNGATNSNEFYKANLSVAAVPAAVPVPAAVWLFGSALAGMGIIGRRRDKPVA